MRNTVQIPHYNPNNHSSFFNIKHHNYIKKFLYIHSNGNVININGVKKQAITKRTTGSVDWENLIQMETILIIECHCRDYSNFPTAHVLGNMLFSTFKPIFNEFSDVRLEYHHSMYSCRD
jgi:hypothetical protein